MKRRFLNWYLILIFVLPLIIYWRWFFSTGSLVYNDLPFYFDETLRELPLGPQLWIDHFQFGHINQTPFTFPIDFLVGIFARFGLQWTLILRLIYIYPIAILSLLAPYLLIKELTGNKIGSFIGALVFSFNPYFLAAIQNGHIKLMMAYVLAPIFLCCVIHSYYKNHMKNIFFASLLGWLISAYDFRIFFTLACISFLYFLFVIFDSHSDCSGFVGIKKGLVIFLSPIFMVLTANLFWLLPFFFSGPDYSIAAINRGMLNNVFTIINSITIGYSTRNMGVGMTNWNYISPHLWILPFVGLFSIFYIRKDKNTLFFITLLLFGIFLGKQDAGPFPAAYAWFFNHIPGFNAFREASKFYYIIAMAYSVLIGFFVDWVCRHSRGIKRVRWFNYLLIALIVFSSLWNSRLIINGSLDSLFVTRDIPEDYLRAKNLIVQNPGYYGVLWVPNHSSWSFYSKRNPLIGLDSLVQDWTWRDKITHNYKRGLYPSYGELSNVMERKNDEVILVNTPIKYVILIADDSEKHEQYYNIYSLFGKRDFFADKLDSYDYLRKLDIGTESVDVYENREYKPFIYTFSEESVLQGLGDFEEIVYTKYSPTKYSIPVKNVREPLYVTFSQSYHPDWRIRIGDFKWYKSLFNHNYFLAQDIHLSNNANLNTYYIDPPVICDRFVCDENEDGSYNFDITIYFKPQSLTNLGLVISGLIILVISTSVFLHTFIRKINQNA